MILLLLFLLIPAATVGLYMNQRKFGKLPSGARLERIRQSLHYKNGVFQNIEVTPTFSEGVTYPQLAGQFFFGGSKDKTPHQKLPSVKTNLHDLDLGRNVLIWMGHSSYYMQVDGKRILVDPVLSGSASPVGFNVRAFDGTDIYKSADIPEIDFLFITHDHWDHLDYKTIVEIMPKIKAVFCPLGVGEHLEYWGYDMSTVTEMDWYEDTDAGNGFKVFTTPARHFSGRGFIRAKSLWASFVLKTPSMQIFIGGDSGYSPQFKEIGDRFGRFDWAILENGQYNPNWKYIHMLPEHFMTAAKELKAKNIIPVHSSKFALSQHDWYEPLSLVVANNAKEKEPLNISTPQIGEVVNLDGTQAFEKWWEGYENSLNK